MTDKPKNNTEQEWSPETSGLSSAQYYNVPKTQEQTQADINAILETAGMLFMEMKKTGKEALVIPCGGYTVTIGLQEVNDMPVPAVIVTDAATGQAHAIAGADWHHVKTLLEVQTQPAKQVSLGRKIGEGIRVTQDTGLGSHRARQGSLNDAFLYAISRV